MLETSVLRLSAFTVDPAGGNPAGVLISPSHPSDLEMQAIAAQVGYSETAFLAPVGDRAYRVRYFSPLAEVHSAGTRRSLRQSRSQSGPGQARSVSTRTTDQSRSTPSPRPRA